jgi:hypothetical protein
MTETDPTHVWAWSAALVLVTITLHVVGIGVINRTLRFWKEVVDAKISFLETLLGEVVVIVGVALALALLHGVESMIWAIAYVRLGAISSWSDALLYSVGSMTTRGSAGVETQTNWLIAGAIESGDGMLLFGISTAFLFSVMAYAWKSSSRHPWF